MTATCRECHRAFTEGESGWVEDVKVITPSGVRLEQRYTCDQCEEANQ